MNKKVISKIATMVGVMAVIALLVAKLYDIGVHRPSLVFKQLSPNTIQWLNTFNQYNPESIMKASSVGPFDWDNKRDIGQTHKDGKWAKEEDANVVVYYRKDREAKGQTNAKYVMSAADGAILEIQDYLATYHYPADLNGRKVPFYLPSTDEEYTKLLNKMSSNGMNTTSKYGCSIIAVGPLGCQNKGILIHPDAFAYPNSGADPAYVRVVRRELAYYTYLANLDYNKDTHRFAWFVQGVTENFAMEGRPLPLEQKHVTLLANECFLTRDFPTNLSRAGGTSFIQFYERTYGRLGLKELISKSYIMPVDSAFSALNMNTDSLKMQWIESLQVGHQQQIEE